MNTCYLWKVEWKKGPQACSDAIRQSSTKWQGVVLTIGRSNHCPCLGSGRWSVWLDEWTVRLLYGWQGGFWGVKSSAAQCIKVTQKTSGSHSEKNLLFNKPMSCPHCHLCHPERGWKLGKWEWWNSTWQVSLYYMPLLEGLLHICRMQCKGKLGWLWIMVWLLFQDHPPSLLSNLHIVEGQQLSFFKTTM